MYATTVTFKPTSIDDDFVKRAIDFNQEATRLCRTEPRVTVICHEDVADYAKIKALAEKHGGKVGSEDLPE